MQATKLVFDDMDRDGVYSRAVTETFYNDDGSVNYVVNQRDNENDGVIDYYESQFNGYDGSGTKYYDVSYVDYGNDGLDFSHLNYYFYDAAGNVTEQHRYRDEDGDGSYETGDTFTAAFNASNQIVNETDNSPDWDGDGTPDYSTVNNYSYSSSGQLTAKETTYLNNGQQSALDYRLESFTYNDRGLLAEYHIDDWSEYDFVIGLKYTYNSSGQVTNVKYQDEFVFGDNKWHNAETYKYSKTDGSLKESNLYDEYVNGVHVLEDKAKFYYDDGFLTKEVHTGQDSSWNTVTGYQNEMWYDDFGRLTTKLTSFDQDGDGQYEEGTRTLEQWAFGDGYTEYSIDQNAGDGHTEYLEYDWVV